MTQYVFNEGDEDTRSIIDADDESLLFDADTLRGLSDEACTRLAAMATDNPEDGWDELEMRLRGEGLIPPTDWETGEPLEDSLVRDWLGPKTTKPVTTSPDATIGLRRAATPVEVRKQEIATEKAAEFGNQLFANTLKERMGYVVPPDNTCSTCAHAIPPERQVPERAGMLICTLNGACHLNVVASARCDYWEGVEDDESLET